MFVPEDEPEKLVAVKAPAEVMNGWPFQFNWSEESFERAKSPLLAVFLQTTISLEPSRKSPDPGKLAVFVEINADPVIFPEEVTKGLPFHVRESEVFFANIISELLALFLQAKAMSPLLKFKTPEVAELEELDLNVGDTTTPVKVLLPEKDWVVLLTKPGNVAEALCAIIAWLALIFNPSAEGDPVSIVPTDRASPGLPIGNQVVPDKLNT